MTTTTPQITLHPTQQRVLDQTVKDLLNGKREVSIAGLAGTGKSVTADKIATSLETYGKTIVTACPTGKAANVLRTKGRNADTIHSLIYNFKGKYVDDLGEEFIAWEDKDKISDCDIILVDEASMVNDKMASDLRAFKKQIIWIGDHGQLPPIGKDPMIMKYPDHELTEILRQADGSDIIEMAHTVRTGHRVQVGEYLGVSVLNKTPWRKLFDDRPFDQVIVGYNNTRVKFNRFYREYHGIKGLPNVGERMICLLNNRRQGIFNGMQFTILDILSDGPDSMTCEIVTDCGKTKCLNLMKGALHGNTIDTEGLTKEDIVCDFAYAITCHKSQGSEWNNVMVLSQPSKYWDMSRWLYTAVTRAKENLIVVNQ